MKSADSLRAISDLKPGDHLRWLYEAEEEHRRVLTPFVGEGLERGEKALCRVDAHTADAVLDSATVQRIIRKQDGRVRTEAQPDKGDPRTKAIPVVIPTPSKGERDLVHGYPLGDNSYIQKPVDFHQFRQTVRQLGLFWLVVNQPPRPTPSVPYKVANDGRS